MLICMCMATLFAEFEWADPELITDVPMPQYGGMRVGYIVDTSVSTEARDVNLGGESISRIKAIRMFLSEMEILLRGNGNGAVIYPQTVIPFAGMAN